MTLKFKNLSQTEIDKISHIDSLDWEIEDADTRYATHGYHPYSAKYIPQIPNYLRLGHIPKDKAILGVSEFVMKHNPTFPKDRIW